MDLRPVQAGLARSLPGQAPGADGAAPPAEAARLERDLAPFQLGQRHFVLDFFAHREDDLVPGNLVSLLMALEHARSMDALAPLLRAMAEVPEEDLRRDLFQWMLLLAARHEIELPPIEELEKMASLDNFHSQLDKRMGQWTQEWFAQGRSEGMQEGLQRGRSEGVADQRAMLVRQASLKFGPAAEGFDALLAEVGSSKALAEVGEWLLAADTAGELATKVRAGIGGTAEH